MSEGRVVLRVALSAIVLAGACGRADRGSADDPWELRAADGGSSESGKAGSDTWLRTGGKEGPEGEAQTRPAVLSFDCLPGRAISTLMTDQALRQGSAEVQLELDANSPRKLSGFAGTTPTGGQIVLTIPQDSVLALLGGHQRATVKYADGAGSSRTTAVFPIAGLEKHRERFLAACARAGAQPK
jgi:hypothetical protein